MKRTSSILFALVLALSLVLIIAGPMVTPVQATEKVSGPKSGLTAVSDNLTGEVDWENEDGALTQDGDHAVALLQTSLNTSEHLKVTNFSFNIPGTADIKGIKVEVDRYYSTPGTATVLDNSIRLVQGGSITGASRSAGATWPNSETDNYESFGNSNDLWGLTWDPADINSSGFGVAIQAVLGASGAANAWVDHVRITVYYSVPEYYLTMAANPGVGGTAIDVTNTSPYEEGEEVTIRAEPAMGYWFANWTAVPTSGGTPTSDGFADPEDEETIFTMPAYNVTVTASFSDEPVDREPPEVTTLSASGKTQSGATLNMDYTRGDWTSVRLEFVWKEHGTIDWVHTGLVIRAQDGPYHKKIGGLTADTEYDFQARLWYDSIEIDTADIVRFKTDKESSCPITLAAHGTPTAEQIDVLREFRDSVLLEGTAGSQFVSLYYQLSPPVADVIAGNELLRTMVRELLVDPIVWIVQATGDSWRN